MDGSSETNDGSARGGRRSNGRGRRRGGRGRHGKGGDGDDSTTPSSTPESATHHQQPKNIAAQIASAAVSLSVEILNTLLANNRPLVNVLDHKGETLLTLVCGLKSVPSPEKHTAIVETLFAHGALLSVKNKHERAAFTLACSRHHVHLLPLLLQEAVKQEQVNPRETVPALLLATLGGLDERTTDSNRGRWDAIQVDPEGCFQTVEFLLEQTKLLKDGESFVQHAIRALTPRGFTPLHLAAGLFQSKTVAYLLDNQADPHAHEDNPLTPVQYLDECFRQVEPFLFDPKVSNQPPATSSAPADNAGNNSGRGRGKRSNGPSRTVSAVGTSVEARALDTVMEFSKHCGLEPLFGSHGCFTIQSRRLKNLLVGHLGLATILNKTCAAKDTMGDTKLVLLDYVAGLYRALHKNPDLRSFWDAAIRRPPSDYDGTTSSIHPFTPKSLDWIVKGLTEDNCNARFLSTWAYIVADVLKLYTPTCQSPISDVKVFTAITASMARSVKKLMFNLCDTDTTDDDYEIKLLFVRFEMLLLWIVPYLKSLPDDINSVRDVLKVVTEPLAELKVLVPMALRMISGDVYTPDRFAAALYMLQLEAQLETWVETKRVVRLHQMLKAQVEKPHAHTWLGVDDTQVPIIVSRFSSMFGLPASFVQWMLPLRDPVNALLRAEIHLMPEFFQDWTSHASFISTANKLEYIEAMADRRYGRFQLTINRQVSTVCFLDFVIQQVLCTSNRNLTGEMEINFLNEPGLGVGPLREFFELVGQHFFNPSFSLPSDDHDHQVLPQAKSIFSQWLQMARQNISATQSPPPPPSQTKPLASPMKKNHSSALWLPIFGFADSKHTSLCFQNHPLSVTTPPTKEQDGVYHTSFDQLVENADLAKVYRCAGRLMGLALRHQAPLGVHLPEAFWKFVRGSDKLTWQDYTDHSPQFQASLATILDHDFTTSPPTSDQWDLYFETCGAVVVVDGQDSEATDVHYASTEIELVPGGKSMQVTNDNKAHYVQLRAERFFCNQMANMHAFQKARVSSHGVLDVICKRELVWLTPAELQSVAHGAVVVDVEAMEKHVHYARPAHRQHPTIANFWAVVRAMDQPTLRQLLTFWSGSSLPPLFGFDATEGNTWSIKLTPRDNAVHWPCPQAVTCDHQLLLPEYPSLDILREKVMVALSYGSLGFDRV